MKMNMYTCPECDKIYFHRGKYHRHLIDKHDYEIKLPEPIKTKEE